MNGSLVSLEWRERRTNNLIDWTAGDDFIWRPMNVDETLRKSYSISFRAPFMTQSLAVSGYLTGNEMNDLANNKSLPYVPTHTGQLLLQYSWQPVPWIYKPITAASGTTVSMTMIITLLILTLLRLQM